MHPGVAEQSRTFAANRAAGAVTLAVVARAGTTRRFRVAESGSLRVRFPGAAGTILEAVAINTAGGVAGGDRFTFDVAVGEGASLTLSSASAEKIYRSLGDDAEIAVSLKVASGAKLAWLPRETILFDGARLCRSIDVDLADDGRLVLAEAVVFGRRDMGECVTAGRFADRWRIRRGGRLVYAESLAIDGDMAARLDRKAVANGAIALATLLVAPADDQLTTAVRAIETRGEVGVSSFNGLTAVRFCAADGDSLRHDLTAVLRAALAQPLPRLWLN